MIIENIKATSSFLNKNTHPFSFLVHQMKNFREDTAHKRAVSLRDLN